MFVPIKWLKPRLKPLCVAYGVADMSLILLSILGWYFLFDIAYRAQHNHHLLEYRKSLIDPSATPSPSTGHALRPSKDDISSEDLRTIRTIRACGLLDKDVHGLTDEELAGPASLIGAAMGGYFILGALLASLSLMDYPAARKVACTVCLMGQGACTLFLIVGIALITSDEALCPTEYYFEDFQPILLLLTITTIFILTYKTYEITLIAFYLTHESRVLEKEEIMNAEAITHMDSSQPREDGKNTNTVVEESPPSRKGEGDVVPASRPKSPGPPADNRFYRYVDGEIPD